MRTQRLMTLALAGGLIAALTIAAAPSAAHTDSGPEISDAALTLVLAADGQELWTKNCKKCHGPDGKAQTKMGAKHKIPDLTDATWQGKHSKEKVTKVIAEGVADTKMKAYKDKLSAAEIDALATFVKALK